MKHIDYSYYFIEPTDLTTAMRAVAQHDKDYLIDGKIRIKVLGAHGLFSAFQSHTHAEALQYIRDNEDD